MNMKKTMFSALALMLALSVHADALTKYHKNALKRHADTAAAGAWVKYEKNPVLGGGDLGTIFDICVLKTDKGYTMFSSWRPPRTIAVHYSKDGFNWTPPKSVLLPTSENFRDWSYRLNRPGVLYKDGVYHMWFTGQENKPSKARIGYATSKDGEHWQMRKQFVMESTEKWEGESVMCPHVIWDESEKIVKMWYSGGESYEPNAIGYATSKDGVSWKKYEGNPVCVPDKRFPWERERVTACQVIKRRNDYLMFYIGFENVKTARICMARSKDGIRNWERYKGNPIIQPEVGSWDADATYKPYAIFNGKDWLLWYNGRTKRLERIGVAVHKGADLGF